MFDDDNITDEELDEAWNGTLAVQESMVLQLSMVVALFAFIGVAAAIYYPHFREQVCIANPQMCVEPMPAETLVAKSV
jgi:hypothetical protein